MLLVLLLGIFAGCAPNGARVSPADAPDIPSASAPSSLSAPAAAPASAPDLRVPSLRADSPAACVASAHPLASKAGVEALRQGGNAVDAAVATAFTLAVVEPHASGPGGGGFLLYFDPATRQTHFIDYREKASTQLRPEHAMKEGSLNSQTMSRGGMAVGAPGMVRGLLQAHARFGRLPLEMLLEPAARHAEQGFPISAQLAVQMSNQADLLLEYKAGAEAFLEDGMFPREQGTPLQLPVLGATIRDIIARGEKAIYDEQPAQQISEAVRAAGGVLTARDILDFQPRWREPLVGSYRGYTIVTAAPPSSGGIQILQLLAILESFPVGKFDPHSPEYLALLLTAIAAAQTAAEAHVADPAFHSVPIADLLSRDWAANIASTITFLPAAGRPDPEREDGKTAKPSPGNTTHLSVLDREGGAVALTQTINDFFGSGVFVEPLGILLNDQLYDFTFQEGAVNIPEAGKIPRSSMSPTLIFRDGRLVASLGTPGGRRIGAALAQIIINKIDFGFSLQEAVNAPRIFVETNNGRVSYESRLPRANVEAAVKLLDEKAFRSVREMSEYNVYFGGAQGCWLEETPEGLLMTGAADPRRDGFVEYLSPGDASPNP